MRSKIKTILIGTFAIIGCISSIHFFYDFIMRQKEANEYSNNCKKVKTGMSVKDAKIIMGDYEWWKKRSGSQIGIIENNDLSNKYFLGYPIKFGGSGNIYIYFDPNTQIITNVVCSED